MKTMKNFFLRTIVIGVLGLLLVNCEDGDVGPAGADGINGIDGVDGTNGANGIDGQNGVGFDELTKFGSITLTLEGTRPDDVSFSITDEFKFTAVEDIDFNNEVRFVENRIDFNIERTLSVPDDDFQGSEIEINLDITNQGETDETIEFILDIDNYVMIFDDLSYLGLDNSFEKDEVGITNFSMSDFSFNDETNEVSFSFSFNVDATNNDTGHDLSISGEVNAILVEDIEDIEI